MAPPIALESVSRHVKDLAAATAFYRALGFAPVGDAADWHDGADRRRLWGLDRAECREQRLQISSAVSGRPFPLHLRQFRGPWPHDWTAIDAWAVGSGHLGLGVEDPYRTWDELAAQGELRPQTRSARPLPMPDEFRDEAERHVERPFAAFRDPDGLTVEIQPSRRAHPATPNWVALADEGTGFSHVDLNVPDMDEARAFFEALGLEFPAGPFESFAHPWLSDLFGTPAAEDKGWTIVYSRLPEAHADGALLSVEFIEFHGLEVDAGFAAASVADPGVTLLGFRVDDLEACIRTATAAGARVETVDGPIELDDGARAVVLRAPGCHAFLELRQP
jgi:catechol 2,3-dioxygenase-like lactoylglutathione lyase family enzyme